MRSTATPASSWAGILSARCRTEEALAAVEWAVLERLPAGSRGGLKLTTDNGTHFTSARFLETLAELGITHRRTAYHHPEGNSYIESFNGRLRDECLNAHLFFSLEDAREKLERWRQDYNHCWPHSSLGDLAPVIFTARTVPKHSGGLLDAENLRASVV